MQWLFLLRLCFHAEFVIDSRWSLIPWRPLTTRFRSFNGDFQCSGFFSFGYASTGLFYWFSVKSSIPWRPLTTRFCSFDGAFQCSSVFSFAILSARLFSIDSRWRFRLAETLFFSFLTIQIYSFEPKRAKTMLFTHFAQKIGNAHFDRKLLKFYPSPVILGQSEVFGTRKMSQNGPKIDDFARNAEICIFRSLAPNHC